MFGRAASPALPKQNQQVITVAVVPVRKLVNVAAGIYKTRDAPLQKFFGDDAGIPDIGVRENIVDKSGAWFSYGNDRLGQGRERVKVFLEENPDLSAAIENEIKSRLGLGAPLPKDEAASVD